MLSSPKLIISWIPEAALKYQPSRSRPPPSDRVSVIVNASMITFTAGFCTRTIMPKLPLVCFCRPCLLLRVMLREIPLEKYLQYFSMTRCFCPVTRMHICSVDAPPSPRRLRPLTSSGVSRTSAHIVLVPHLRLAVVAWRLGLQPPPSLGFSTQDMRESVEGLIWVLMSGSLERSWRDRRTTRGVRLMD